MNPRPLNPSLSFYEAPQVPVDNTTDLGQLAELISHNMGIYLQALKESGVLPPTFAPVSSSGICKSKSGQDAQRALIEASEKIIALVSGLPGFYGITRQYFENAALTVAAELNIASVIPIHGQLHADEIASAVGADSSVIVRIMRALTPIFVFEEVSSYTFRHTARSAAMIHDNHRALLLFGGIESAKAAAWLPDALRAKNYRPPTQPNESAFSLVYNGGKKGFFDYIYGGDDDVMGERFTKAMAATISFSYETGDIADIYPFDKLGNPDHPGTIVDIGGGQGHVMMNIAERYSSANLCFVIQDLKCNIDIGEESLRVELQPKFSWMSHNFFDGTQPIIHAEAYFLRHILHDWPDDWCRKILEPIVGAMKPRYSRLLISEMVVLEMMRAKHVALRDLLMMAHTAGMERTAEQFNALFQNVNPGLRIAKIWKLPTSGPGGCRIIEAMLD